MRKIISEYLQRSLRKMTGYSVNLHICIMGGQYDRLFKEKEGRLVLIYQSAYFYIHTHNFTYYFSALNSVMSISEVSTEASVLVYAVASIV